MKRNTTVPYLFLLVIIDFTSLLAQSTNEQSTIPLKVAIYDAAPFGFEHSDGTKAGLMVELWEAIAVDKNWTYEYYMTDMSGLLTGLQEQKFDVGLGAISITPKREQLVDFSQAVNPSGTGIATSAKSQKSRFQTFYWPILVSLGELVGLLLLVLLISGTLVWWVEHKSKNRSSEYKERDIKEFHDALWWSAVTMTTVGYGDKVPSSLWGKILGIVWIFTSVILLSLFTANASAIFNNANQTSFIQSNNDLMRSRVGAAMGSSGEEYLKREHIQYTPYPDIEKAIEAIISGELDCVVSNVPFLQYYNHTKYYKQLAISPVWLLKNNMGIALQEDSPLREEIDLSLLEIIAEPKWQEAVYQYLGE